MLFEKQLIVSFILVILVVGNINDNKIVSSYAGEYFPDEYLEEDIITLTVNDLNNYIDDLSKVINYFSSLNFNKTADVNKAIGIYIMRGIVKRTIMDYWETLDFRQYEKLLDILNKGATIWSYYVAGLKQDFANSEYRFALVLSDPLTLAHSISQFKGNRMRKWIKTNSSINTLLEEMDKKQLCKKEYLRLLYLLSEKYHIRIQDSDFCTARAVYNREPIYMTEMRPCKPDPYCYKVISANPSIAYTLSHRVVNLLIYRLTRRCYFDSNDKDEDLIESLCAQMYRESVYIVRRGFFARDMFIEHVGFCAMLGYKEFFRWSWFNKMNSWVDRNGCIAEDRNFVTNRTVLLKNVFAKINLNMDQELSKVLRHKCNVHLMSVYIITMSSGIRYAAHHVAASTLSQQQKVGPHWVPPLGKIKHI